MIIECEGCRVRDLACGDCVVSFLLGTTDRRLDTAERAALDVLADSGLVPPLRLIGPSVPEAEDPSGGSRSGGEGPAGSRPGRAVGRRPDDRGRGRAAG